jgi:hypothetical protein
LRYDVNEINFGFESSLLVPRDWQTRQKYPNERAESLQRGEWAVSANSGRTGKSQTGWHLAYR